jgi:signal transduction histidine kinase/CheY-like chemotaxis protein/ligand-binding sensor domain-containing protein/protocatechuate 3,4-dioxygenase beta subunit
MKTPSRFFWSSGAMALLILLCSGRASGENQNHALVLDGNQSYLQLPSNIFDHLQEATVEGWIRWDRLTGFVRFFDFGARNREMYVRSDGPQMTFLLCDPEGARHRIEVAGILRSNEWCHIAAVSGRGGAKLYFNGSLIGSNAYTGSFSSIVGRNNYIGKENYGGSATLHGQIDEFRVWDHARTAEQVRETMFQPLSGSEAGLVAYWNFDRGTAHDLGPGGHHATLHGGTQIAQATLPVKESLRTVAPAWLSGTITGPDGNVLTNLDVHIEQNQRALARIRTDETGQYRATVPAGQAFGIHATRSENGNGEADLNLEPGEVRRLDLQLKLTRISGRVVGQDGEPRPGVPVELLRARDRGVVTNAVSTGNGEFRFLAPLPGNYRLRAVVADILHQEPKPIELAWGTTYDAIELRLPRPEPVQVVRSTGVMKNSGVLQLSGEGSYFELPSDIFTHLHEVTVEGWVKWERFARDSRFFDFGHAWHSFNVKNGSTGSDLVFDMLPGQAQQGRFTIRARGALELNRWVHIAAVNSKEGMQLYLNGRWMGSDASPGSLADLGARPQRNFFGRSNWKGLPGVPDEDFEGQMDEIRVWDHARTALQIRTNMFATFSGREPGLVGYWNFDDPADPGRDLSSAQNHGTLHGSATTAVGELPQRSDWVTPNVGNVLYLTGTNSYVDLPPNLLTNVQEGTIEAWVKWETLEGAPHVWDFGGPGQHTYFRPSNSKGDLLFRIDDARGSKYRIEVSGIARPNEWSHVAAVAGTGGTRVYFNGVLVETNAYAGSFSELGMTQNYLGRSDSTSTNTFRGQMDEVRVWNIARTAEQIAEHMFKTLTGREPGLIGYWNFDDGTARDLTSRKQNGKLVGSAQIGEGDLPHPALVQRVEPVTITGRVSDPEGRAVANAEVALFYNGTQTVSTRSGILGDYRLTFFPTREPHELRVTKDDLGYGRTNVVFEPPANHTWDVVLAETSISGQASSPDEQSHAARKVDLLRGAHRTVVATTLTDAAGHYRFKVPAPDFYQVGAQTPAGRVILNSGNAVEMAMGTQVTGLNFEVAPRQPTAASPVSNRVLQLSGGRAHVNLPANVFGSLEEATVEGWVKWHHFDRSSRFFDFGASGSAMLVALRTDGTLVYSIRPTNARGYPDLNVPGAVRTNRWLHIAAVSGKDGMKLYINGWLAAVHPFAGSFAALRDNYRNYLGRPLFDGDSGYFRGQMDEVRVWVTARTQEQLRENMFKRLTGQEAGLAGLWNFDEDDGTDVTPNRLMGELRYEATTVVAELPRSIAEIDQPCVLLGKITDREGKLVNNGRIELTQGTNFNVAVSPALDGSYRLLFYPTNAPYTLRVVSGELDAWHTNLLFSPGETNFNLVLQDATRISGKVVALDDSPLANVVVQAVGNYNYECTLVDGFKGEYYQLEPFTGGSFPVIPPNQAPVLQRIDPEINFRERKTGDPFTGTSLTNHIYVRWTGVFRLSHPGKYTFHLESDDGSRLFINGQEVIENGGSHPMRVKEGEITLPAGEHHLKLEYFQLDQHHGCRLHWWSEGTQRAPFPSIKPKLATTATDEKGEYRFRHLEPGRYQIRCHLPGQFLLAEEGRIFEVAHDTKMENVLLQTPPFKKGSWQVYSKRNGLPHDQIFAIHETRDGIMWLATLGGGVVRWDGRRFHTLTASDGLANNFVGRLYEAANGTLWFGTDGGASQWDGITFRNYSVANGLTTNKVWAATEDRQGDIWLGTYAGVSRWDGTQFKNYSTNDGLVAAPFGSAVRDREGRLWFGGHGGVSRWDGERFESFTAADGISGSTIFSLFEDRDGTLWLGTAGHGVLRWDGRRFQQFTTQDGLAGNEILCIYQDAEGMMWFGTWQGGVSRFDGTHFVNYSTIDGLPENRVHAIHQDQDGVMWFGTFNSGLASLDERSRLKFTKADGLPENNTATVAEDKQGHLWFGTASRGVSRWDGRRFENFSTVHGLPDNSIHDILVAEDGVIWFATPRGVSRWNGERFENLTGSHGLPDNNVQSLLQSRDGMIWIGTQNGLSRWDGRRLERFTTANGLVNNQVYRMGEDSSGTLWFASPSAGISLLHGGRFLRLPEPEPLQNRQINALYTGEEGNWLGFSFGGAARLDGTNLVAHYDPGSGLGASYATHIFRDADGVMWLAHHRDISLFDGVTWSSFPLNIGSDERMNVNPKDMHQGPDGAIWIASEAGVYRLQRTREPKRPPVLQIKADKELADFSSAPRLPARSRLTFNFAQNDRHTPPDKQRFRYKILSGARTAEEVQKSGGWSAAMRETQVDWTTNLAGTYTFAVQYLNEYLRYSPAAVATFELVPLWHQNALIVAPAGVGLAALLGVACVSTVRFRRKRREAEQLRLRLFEEDQKARHAAENAAIALETKNAQLEQARRAADEANQAKSSFLANMSHELRTPMNAIIGYSEMLQEEAEDLDQKSFIPDLQKIHGAGKHLLGLINDILDLSKVEAGKMSLYIEEFDVSKLVQEVASTVRPLVEKNSNCLEVRCPGDLGVMRADLTKVRQTLFNLLSNASRFTEQGTITLTVSREENLRSPIPHFLFRVADTGIGMNLEQISRLFQVFSQADASTTRKYGGTGLGLAISKKFCQLMGGDISVTSQPGQGSVFTITLPAEAHEPAPEPSSSSSDIAGASDANALGMAGARILVIDDDPLVRDLMTRSLGKNEFQVLCAADGQSGLALARQFKPAVITLDVMMPGMDGWAVLAELKADPELADIPVIMVTMVDDKNIGFSLGATDYFTKPIDWQRLGAVLAKYRPSGDGHSVLLVEDDPQTREMLRRALKKEGWEVTEATNGREGLEQVAASTPTLILLDLMMPELDGFGFIQRLRDRPEGRDTPVIVITAKDLSAEDRRRLNGNVTRIVQKGSMSWGQLLQELKALLARKSPPAQ